jgi:hypothetical protein
MESANRGPPAASTVEKDVIEKIFGEGNWEKSGRR